MLACSFFCTSILFPSHAHRHARRAFSFALVSVHLFKNHRSLNAVAAHQTFAAAVGRGDGMEPIAFGGLLVDDILQLSQVSRAGADELFLQGDLKTTYWYELPDAVE